ncbi:PREDICTED: retinol dehydrogenase 11-like [Papilio xuthus]|uniref:Retinol dehydrogenase 11-like n=1 Tax=Papilio xuthus TaxID=66420 RepID=A0AAJ6ZGU1_PAPXU
MFVITTITIATFAAATYWIMNRHKPLKHLLSDFRYMLDMQGAGAGGLIDDWINIRRNKIELPDASRKIAVITGGARGIGTEVVRGLLKANVTVIMGIRKPDAAKKMMETMENGKNLHVFSLDLQSQKSVKEFANCVTKEFPEINYLINNAGIMYGDYKLTEDGIESQFAVNHLNHFYLTHLLLPALKKAGRVEEPSRVVNVSSCGHYPGKIFFDDINMKEHYDTIAAYAQSKLAQIMTARYLNKLLDIQDANVKFYSVHPGIVDTDLFENTTFNKLPWLKKIFFKTPEKGATPILFACFNKNIVERGGLYISNCIEGISNRYSKNIDHQKKLFDISCELTGIDPDKFGKN